MHRIFSADCGLAVLNTRKSARDHRLSQPLVQQLALLIILCILCIDVEWMVLSTDLPRRCGRGGPNPLLSVLNCNSMSFVLQSLR